MKHYFRNIVMPSLLAFLVSSSAFGQQPEEERSRLYGGPDSGGTVNKSIITYDSVEWQTAWFKNLGGLPPQELPQGHVGVLVFAAYPGHLISLHRTDSTATPTIRCHQAPLPDSKSHIAPASWAAGIFKADDVILEECP
ncbi:hypothetical protein [Halomonas sp. THAF12]|uniref:hypothetical protein n=1 Tax=Halomonas sp. THAF12 TaxID=2587849 RepID=UPI0012682368|nr:hypothetical protein [Halomonas sp. THAF12]